MALDSIIRGSSSGAGAEVAGTNQLKVIPETNAANNAANIGGLRLFSENDQGLLTNVVRLRSPEVDVDYRMRVSQDLVLEEEIFNYTAQNTGKHSLAVTTMAAAFTAGQLTTNSGSITSVGAGLTVGSYAYFPNMGTQTLSCDFELGFSNQPVTNTLIDFGLFIRGSGPAYAPGDGAFFRLTSAGLQGIASSNGTETSTGIFPLAAGAGQWTYATNKRYQFIVYLGGVEAQFWVNDGTGPVLLGAISLPDAQGRICMSGALPWSIRHAIAGGSAGGLIQLALGAVNVRLGGANVSTTASTQGNRLWGSYQGLSGGTMGQLANYANNTNPTAVVPTNTGAALGVGLGGQFWETDTLAVNTDGIIQSYQVPAGTANVPGKRCVLRGVKISSYVQTALTGGGYVAQYALAFGHTNVSLATTESATSKAPRRVPLGIHAVASGAVANTLLGDIWLDLGGAPVYVNPGEFIQIARKKVGAAPTAGTIAHTIAFVYGWE